MRFGLFLPSAQFPGRDHGSVLRDTVAAACAAETAGFDDVWVRVPTFPPLRGRPANTK